MSSNLLGKLQKLEKHVTTADPTRPDLVDKSRSQGPVPGFNYWFNYSLVFGIRCYTVFVELFIQLFVRYSVFVGIRYSVDE